MHEAQNLELLWNALCDSVRNGNTEGIHPPPALMEASAEIAAGQIQGNGITADEVPDGLFQVMVQFGEAMFHFGQFCSARGLLRANMEPCQCGQDEVSDASIAAFFEGVTFSNEQPEQPNA